MEREQILVTGCGRGGIGEALASQYRAQGCVVIATVLPNESHGHLSDLGCYAHSLDVTSPTSIEKLADFVDSTFQGRISVLVNNAGICYTMPAIDNDIVEVDKMFDVNVFGPMRMLRRFHPALIEARGTMVNIGSVGGIVPFNYGSAYNASKAALVHWGSTVRVEMAPFGVKVINVVSGNIGTNILNTDSSRQISPGSYYVALAEDFKRHVGRKPGATDRFDYAKAVVKESLKPKPRSWFWHGHTTWLVWFLDTFGARSVWDMFLWRMFNLSKLQAERRKPH